MQRDIAAGKPSELDYLAGAVVRLGKPPEWRPRSTAFCTMPSGPRSGGHEGNCNFR